MRLNLLTRAPALSPLKVFSPNPFARSVETSALRRTPALQENPLNAAKNFSGLCKRSFVGTYAVGQDEMATNGVNKTDKDLYGKEQKLLLAAKTIDQALIERDSSLLDKVFDKNIVLHADRLTVKEGRKGDDVKQYYVDYWTNYEYQHYPVVTAANGKINTAFTFAVDENVKHTGSSGKASLSVSIWAYEFTDDLKVSDIWFLRSLTDGEVDDLLKERPTDLGLTAEDYQKLRDPQLPADKGRSDALYKAAESYSNMWATGKPADTGAFLEGSFHEMDPLLGNKIEGRDGIEHAIKSLSLMWESTSQSHSIAVTPDSLKAFVLWKQDGYFKESKKQDSLYGLNLMVFDKQHKIEKVLGFRQIMQTEKGKMMK